LSRNQNAISSILKKFGDAEEKWEVQEKTPIIGTEKKKKEFCHLIVGSWDRECRRL